MAKLLAKRCPSCGANISIPPNAHDVPCRYCGNVIHVEHKKPPPQFHPLGTPGGMPSTTLYIDPAEIARTGRVMTYVIVGAMLLPVILGVVMGIGPWALGKAKKNLRPFPAECGVNEDLELSGDWQGDGPVVTSAGVNCTVHITKSNLKARTLVDGEASNVTIILEDVTLETTDVAMKVGNNAKVTVKDGSIKSAASVFTGKSNVTFALENTTIQSSGAVAVDAGHNFKLEATNTKIFGKKTALDFETGDLTLKKGSEVTSEGVAIKASSGLKLEAEGGKIDGAEGAVVATSGAKISATATTFSSGGVTFKVTSGADVDLTGGAVTSKSEAAIESDGGSFDLAGAKVQGATAAFASKNGLKLKATKKASIVTTSGDAIDVTSNAELSLTDASIEAAGVAVKATVNTELKLGAGARVSGKKGGVVTDHNLRVDASGATIDGGSGPGIDTGYNARIKHEQGVLKGNPAIKVARKPQLWDVSGTRIEGSQNIPAR